jgi:anthranilate phosphoribosyltransferase
VAKEALLKPMAGALAKGSVNRAFVVHGKDAEGRGMDEASTEGPTMVIEISEGILKPLQVLVPRELGIPQPAKDALRVSDRAEALRVARGLHGGSRHADYRPEVADGVALQVALGLVLHRDAGLASLPEYFREAKASLEGGFSLPLPTTLEVR